MSQYPALLTDFTGQAKKLASEMPQIIQKKFGESDGEKNNTKKKKKMSRNHIIIKMSQGSTEKSGLESCLQ